MSLTIPAELAGFASLAGAPAELFTLDEDALEAAGHALARFATAAAPSPQQAGSAAAGYVDASGGDATAAFAGYWQDSGAAAGDTQRTITSAGDGSDVLLASATAIKVAKVGVITALAWLARKQIMALAAPAAQTAAVVSARLAVRRIWTKLVDLLAGKMRSLRQLMDGLARPGGARLAHASAGPGSYGTLGAKRLENPYSPDIGVTRMNMGARERRRLASEMDAHNQEALDLAKAAQEDARKGKGDPGSKALHAELHAKQGEDALIAYLDDIHKELGL